MHQRNITRLIAAGTIVVAGTMLPSCAVSNNGGGSDTIRVIAQAGGPGTALAEAAKVWNKDHSTKVEVDLFDYDATRERTVLGFSSGKSSYDVIGLDYAWEKQYVESGYLESLNDMVKADADAVEMEDYIQAYVDWGTIDDEQYALPWFGAVYMLYYRTDLLQQAGVEVPTTWDELLDPLLPNPHSSFLPHPQIFAQKHLPPTTTPLALRPAR